jgi:hypothetical protein
LPSLRRMCVHKMCKLSVLPWVVSVLFVGTLTVRFLAPAEAQEVSYLEGAACGQCGGGAEATQGLRCWPLCQPLRLRRPLPP